MKPFQFSVIAWGQAYVDLLVNVSLPSQLSAGNLPAVPVTAGTQFRIFTTDEHLNEIRQSAAFRRLAALMPTRLTRVEMDGQPQPHKILTECHRHALADAAEQRANAVFVSPDGIYAEGSHARLVQLARAGMEVVMVSSIRLSLSGMLPALKRRFPYDAQGALAIQPRQLVRLTMEHPHRITRELFWPPTSRCPSHLYWPVGDEGILARCFHVHPMMVAPPPESVSFDSTIDGDYVWRAFPDLKRIYVVRDSDELCVGEISRDEFHIKSGERPMSSEEIAVWTSLRTNPLHIAMFRQPFRFHACTPSNLWPQVEAEAAEAVQHAVMYDVVNPLRRAAFSLMADRQQAHEYFTERVEWLLTGRIDALLADLHGTLDKAQTPLQRDKTRAAIDYYHCHRPHLQFGDYLKPQQKADDRWRARAS